jgi:predicted dienelactone hydrolase
VLIFSHGGGEARETYAAQLEDLASHGYVVAAISHTYDAVLTVFPDGRHAGFAPGRWPRPATSAIPHLPPGQEASLDRMQWWADDIRLALDELTRENRWAGSTRPYAGHLDLARVGAFGHSAGGQAAARACQIEPRLSACLNQDGLSGGAPYYPDGDGWGMDQPFMLILRSSPATPPGDEELAAMGITREQAVELLSRLQERQDAALHNTGGAYRITLDAALTTHADFGDLPLLQASDRAEEQMRVRALELVRGYTRSFFDETLKQLRTPPLDADPTDELVLRVEHFDAARRPRFKARSE